VEGEKGFLARKKREMKSHIFRAPSRRRWDLVGLVLSLGWIYGLFVACGFGLMVTGGVLGP
jgi:hypothetical protein